MSLACGGQTLLSGEARQALATPLPDNPLELARLLSVLGQGQVAAGRLDDARATLAETQALAEAVGAGAHSELGREIAKLREATA